MRMHGYCTKCHRIRVVTVRILLSSRGIQHGICTSCEDKAAEALRQSQQRHPATHRSDQQQGEPS